MADDLANFLLARLDEDEATARAALGEAIFQRQTGTWVFEEVEVAGVTSTIVFAVADKGGRTQVADMSAAWEPDERGAHIARHDPAAVLADVESKRRIVVAAEKAWSRSIHDDPMPEGGEWLLGHRQGLLEALRLLALPYDTHPDYREDWRP